MLSLNSTVSCGTTPMCARKLSCVSSRLSPSHEAVEVIVLGGGQCVEGGTKAGLLAADGGYARLWKMQQREKVPKSGPALPAGTELA